MSKSNLGVIKDSWIMFKRGLLIAMRQPEVIVMSSLTPFFMMLLFGELFGAVINIDSLNYIDFIVPGIIIQSIAQASQYSAINVATDTSKGMIDRFRSMSVSKSSVIIGHICSGMLRNTIAIIVIIGTAFLIGFRPEVDVENWFAFAGILLLINIAISSFAVLCGFLAKVPESAGGLMFPLFILPFISSGFVPIENLSGVLKWVAEVQPMTHMIDCMRSFILGTPLKDSLTLTFLWCMGIIIVSYVASVYLYRKKTS